ncbi:MAG: glycosyl hydrolase family 65 protein, partial [Ilumatobacter sp.]
ERWVHVRDHLVLPGPDDETQLIEQFRGFFELEDITPADLRERLLDPAEYWGWPNGIAVRTQVSKQADVAMLTWLHAGEFSDVEVAANYDYYEPRCTHNSSLSHAAYGMAAARLGRSEAALEHFRATALVDLLNTNHAVVGGTFIGGIHTAACGGTIQLAVHGIGGLGFDGEALTVSPSLPAAWTMREYPVHWRGQNLRVRAEHGAVSITADAQNDRAVDVVVAGRTTPIRPGTTATVSIAASASD